ncbi:MAG: type ISP restriction/modification enzyme, partial [Terriglobia bacterium]
GRRGGRATGTRAEAFAARASFCPRAAECRDLHPPMGLLLIRPAELLLFLTGADTFEYRLGNRSALEWVVDQYQVTEDKHSGIRSDPNRPDDPEYIVRLVGQVIRVSLETVKLVNSLPAL